MLKFYQLMFLLIFTLGLKAQEKTNYSIGYDFFNKMEYDSALVYLNKAHPSISAYKYKAESHIKLFNYESALTELEKGIALADSLKDAKLKIPLLITYGTFYFTNEDEDNAIRQYNFAKSIAEQYNIEKDIQTLNRRISSAYLSKLSSEYDSLNIVKLVDSILLYSKPAREYFENTDDNETLAKIYNTEATAYSNIGEFQKANKLYEKSAQTHKDDNDLRGYGYALLNWAASNYSQNDLTSSQNQLEEVIELAKEIGDTQLGLVAQHNITFVYEDRKEYKKAYYNYIDFARKEDSVKTISNADELKELEARLNYNIVASENAINKSQKLEQSLKARRSRSMALGLGGALFLTILGLLFFNQHHKFKHRNLHFQLYEREQEAEINAINAMIDGREEERRTIAAALHDSVTTMLASANMHVEAYKLDNDVDNASLERAQSLIDDVTDKVRNLSHSLVSAVLIQFGLEKAIQDICEKLTTTQLSFDSSVELDHH